MTRCPFIRGRRGVARHFSPTATVASPPRETRGTTSKPVGARPTTNCREKEWTTSFAEVFHSLQGLATTGILRVLEVFHSLQGWQRIELEVFQSLQCLACEWKTSNSKSTVRCKALSIRCKRGDEWNIQNIPSLQRMDDFKT